MDADSTIESRPLNVRRSTLEVEEGVVNYRLQPGPAQPDAASTKGLLLVKVTGYRLLWTAVVVTFGTVKLVKSLEGREITVTWVDGVLGIILGTILWWLGHYENVLPAVMTWFFHKDLTADLLYLSSGVVFATLSFWALFLAMFCFIVSTVIPFSLSFQILFTLRNHWQIMTGWALIAFGVLFIPAIVIPTLTICCMYKLMVWVGIQVMFVVRCMVRSEVIQKIGAIISNVIDAWKAGYTSRANDNPFVYVVLPLISGLTLSVYCVVTIFNHFIEDVAL